MSITEQQARQYQSSKRETTNVVYWKIELSYKWEDNFYNHCIRANNNPDTEDQSKN